MIRENRTIKWSNCRQNFFIGGSSSSRTCSASAGHMCQWEATNKKLSEQEPILTGERDHYKRYDRMMKNWIEEEVQNGMVKVEAQYYLLNFRTKLKV
jgi:hypothetical protein